MMNRAWNHGELIEGEAVRIVNSAAGPVGATGTVYFAAYGGDWVSVQLDPVYREDANDDGIRELKLSDVAR